MRLIAITGRLYGDYLRAIYETFGRGSFTHRELEEKGIIPPDNRNPLFFRNRGVFEIRQRKRPFRWGLTQGAITYMRDEDEQH